MKKIFFLIFFLFACLSDRQASCACAEDLIEIRVHCKENSEVKAILPGGEKISLGKVLMTPSKTNWPAYTASKWSENSTVCASAVNAVHILINVENNKGRIISLVPSVTIAPAAGRGSFFSIDAHAGKGLFGRFAPMTGSKVTVERDGVEVPLTEVPQENDVLIIRTGIPRLPEVFMIDIENRAGGRAIAYGPKGKKVIARVIRRVSGVGRFSGTKLQNHGRIRASHSGVIDISTSRLGEIGGFQIIPLKHALTSKEMIDFHVWSFTQWLIIAPLPNELDLEGYSPLYKNLFLPGSLVLCRRNGGEWERLPEVSGRFFDALQDITHLRLYSPRYLSPLEAK